MEETFRVSIGQLNVITPPLFEINQKTALFLDTNANGLSNDCLSSKSCTGACVTGTMMARVQFDLNFDERSALKPRSLK